MEQLGNELKKVIKAGMGAVAAGLELGQDAIEQLAKKGEPLYEQAKSAVADAAGKVKQTIESINAQPQAQEIIDTLRGMGRDAWAQVRAAIDEFEAQADEAEKAAREAAQAAEEILRSASDEEEAPAREAEQPAPEEEDPQQPQE
jgi:polyhydroxyalkanoate synthesis regulator phasin